jgi:hypothetical protein
MRLWPVSALHWVLKRYKAHRREPRDCACVKNRLVVARCREKGSMRHQHMRKTTNARTNSWGWTKATIGANVAWEHGGNLRCFIESYLAFFETKFRLLMMTKNSSYNPFCLGIQNKHVITDPFSCASKTIQWPFGYQVTKKGSILLSKPFLRTVMWMRCTGNRPSMRGCTDLPWSAAIKETEMELSLSFLGHPGS